MRLGKCSAVALPSTTGCTQKMYLKAAVRRDLNSRSTVLLYRPFLLLLLPDVLHDVLIRRAL